MAVNDWGVSFFDGSWVVHNNYLSNELLYLFRRVIQGIPGYKSSFDLVSFQFHVESNIVSWVGGLDLLVVHLDGFDLASEISWSNHNVGFLLKNPSLHTSDSDGSVSLDFVDIVDWNS